MTPGGQVRDEPTGRPRRFVLAIAGALLAAAVVTASAPGAAAFDMRNHSIPIDRIRSGGPPKDGIPALVSPRFVPAEAATFLGPDDSVVGLVENGPDGEVAKAYPLRVLRWHEVVNDKIGGRPVVVSYCPLTGSAVAFDRRSQGEALTFGVSGRLYDSNVLLYDHQSESLWSQLKGAGVTGAKTSVPLTAIPSTVTTWGWWRHRHPHSLVLSIETGYRRDYTRNPYADYERSPAMMFSVANADARVPVKERVLGVVMGGVARAYPLRVLIRRTEPLIDRLGDADLTIRSDPSTETVQVFESDRPVVATVAYWFAWAAFHPDTELWMPATRDSASRGPLNAVKISGTRGYWSNLLGVIGNQPVNDGYDQSGFYVITGAVTNVSNQPIHHVEFEFELLDEAGKVVHRETGFNRAAEGLRLPASGKAPPAITPGQAVKAIPPGEKDSFRMLLFGDEIPDFHDMRVRVVGVE